MRLDDEAVADTVLEEKLKRFNEEWQPDAPHDRKVSSSPVIDQVAEAAAETSPVLSRVKDYTCTMEDEFDPEPIIREAGERFAENVRENFPFDKSVSTEFREDDGNPAYTIGYMTEEVEIRYEEHRTDSWILRQYLDPPQRHYLHLFNGAVEHPSIVFDWRTPDGRWQRTEEYLRIEEILTEYRVNTEKAVKNLKSYASVQDFLSTFFSYGGDAAENMMEEYLPEQYQEFRRQRFTDT